MTARLLRSRVPTIEDLRSALESPLFEQLETHSTRFLRTHARALAPYGRQWVGDPLHQWSRQWEYPFVLAAIEAFAGERSAVGLRILDAGSGVTFFPFYLASRFEEAAVQCCDSDPMLGPIFEAITRGEEGSVDFRQADIGDCGLPDASIDIVYSVSVLEHAAGYRRIIDEFVRLLAPGGLLVVTFDISLDGRADIPPAQAEDLLAALEARLHPAGVGGEGPTRLAPMLSAPDLLTTRRVQEAGLGALPWKSPRLIGAWSDIRRGRWPALSMKLLTVYCAAYRKAGG